MPTPIPHIWQDIPGYADFTDFYAEMVAHSPPGAVLVEVGVGVGRSLAYLAVEAARARKGLRVIGVDDFRHEDFPGVPPGRTQRDAFEQFTAPIKGLFELLDCTSLEAAGLLRAGGLRAHLVFVDASHDHDSVYADCCAWWEVVAPGGVLAGDDYDMLGVRSGVHEFAGGLSAATLYEGVSPTLRGRVQRRRRVERVNGNRGWGLWKIEKPACVL